MIITLVSCSCGYVMVFSSMVFQGVGCSMLRWSEPVCYINSVRGSREYELGLV